VRVFFCTLHAADSRSLHRQPILSSSGVVFEHEDTTTPMTTCSSASSSSHDFGDAFEERLAIIGRTGSGQPVYQGRRRGECTFCSSARWPGS